MSTTKTAMNESGASYRQQWNLAITEHATVLASWLRQVNAGQVDHETARRILQMYKTVTPLPSVLWLRASAFIGPVIDAPAENVQEVDEYIDAFAKLLRQIRNLDEATLETARMLVTLYDLVDGFVDNFRVIRNSGGLAVELGHSE